MDELQIFLGKRISDYWKVVSINGAKLELDDAIDMVFAIIKADDISVTSIDKEFNKLIVEESCNSAQKMVLYIGLTTYFPYLFHMGSEDFTEDDIELIQKFSDYSQYGSNIYEELVGNEFLKLYKYIFDEYAISNHVLHLTNKGTSIDFLVQLKQFYQSTLKYQSEDISNHFTKFDMFCDDLIKQIDPDYLKDTHNPEEYLQKTTVYQQYLTIHTMLQILGYTDLGSLQEKRFLQFITNREIGKRIKDTSIVKSIQGFEKRSRVTIAQDFEAVEKQFERLGLKTAIERLNKTRHHYLKDK